MRPDSLSRFCISHDRWASKRQTPDPFYEKKLVEGFTIPVDEYLTQAEIEATLNGRYRGDGRRIDQYTADDPLGWNPNNKQKNQALARRAPGMAMWLLIEEGLI